MRNCVPFRSGDTNTKKETNPIPALQRYSSDGTMGEVSGGTLFRGCARVVGAPSRPSVFGPL